MREFYKLEASGNDFILLDNSQSLITNRQLKKIAQKYCSRRLGVGADGLLVIEPSHKALFKMKIFNPDGTNPPMCGNGARCSALWKKLKMKNEEFLSYQQAGEIIEFETEAGIIQAKIKNGRFLSCQQGSIKNYGEVSIKMVEPFNLKLGLPIKVLGRKIKINFINTGVPHAVIFVEGLEKIDVERIGREIRFHHRFKPQGTNVDFVEIGDSNNIKVRTYERGVEAETLSCGTGVVASAIITALAISKERTINFKVLTKSKEVLKVHFSCKDGRISDVWLEGRVYLVYKGEIF